MAAVATTEEPNKCNIQKRKNDTEEGEEISERGEEDEENVCAMLRATPMENITMEMQRVRNESGIDSGFEAEARVKMKDRRMTGSAVTPGRKNGTDGNNMVAECAAMAVRK